MIANSEVTVKEWVMVKQEVICNEVVIRETGYKKAAMINEELICKEEVIGNEEVIG